MNVEKVIASEEALDIIKEFEEVIEILQTANDKITLLKNLFASGEFYMGTAEEMINIYYTLMGKKVEQLIQLYRECENYSVNAVTSLLLMDNILSGQYNIATEKIKTAEEK